MKKESKATISKSPDFKLKTMDKSNGYRCNDAGVGWSNPDGSLSISLNPGIVLDYQHKLIINLFPINKRKTLNEDTT